MHIGQEDELAGKEAGERMKAMGVKNALILNQEVGNSGLDQRIRGFKDGFEGPFHHTQVLPVTIDFEKCRQAVKDFLSRNSEVDGIVALGPVAADPALQALKELNKVADVKLCTFDTSPVILNALVNNQLEFAVDQQQWLQGYLPVVLLANYVKYDSMVRNDLILTGPSFVIPANARKALNILSGESGWNPTKPDAGRVEQEVSYGGRSGEHQWTTTGSGAATIPVPHSVRAGSEGSEGAGGTAEER